MSYIYNLNNTNMKILANMVIMRINNNKSRVRRPGWSLSRSHLSENLTYRIISSFRTNSSETDQDKKKNQEKRKIKKNHQTRII